METTSIWQDFQPPPATSPAVREVVEVAGRHEPYNARILHQRWVLDYEFTPCGRYRTVSPSNPWRPREPFTAHLYAPRVPYWENTLHQAGQRHSAWLTFDGGEAAGLMRLISPDRGYGRFLDGDRELGALLREAAEVCRREGDAAFWGVQGLLCRAIDLLLRAKPVDSETWRIRAIGDAFAGASFAEAVRRELRRSLSEKVTLERIAKALHVSPSTLSHRYRREAGESVMTTLIGLRIDSARVLVTRGLALKSVAELTGFSDAFHLSRTFKQNVGLSPREYLRKVRDRSGNAPD